MNSSARLGSGICCTPFRSWLCLLPNSRSCTDITGWTFDCAQGENEAVLEKFVSAVCSKDGNRYARVFQLSAASGPCLAAGVRGGTVLPCVGSI